MSKVFTKSFMRFQALILLLFTFSVTLGQTEIGLQLYTFRNQIPKDVPGMLQKISNMGIRELEGGGTYGLPVDSFKNLLQKNNLKIVSIGAGFNELDSNAQAVVDRAKTFEASYVTCTWIPHDKEFTFIHAKKAVDVFNKAGKLLKENGISLVYHPHGYEFGPHEGSTLFEYMMKKMNPAYANFEMDVFWIKHPGQDPVALLKKYPNRFLLMHLKDRKPGTPGNQLGRADVETNVTLGSGDVGIADIMREAPKAGVKHYFIEDESSRSEQQVPESLAFLKSLKTK
jgi:sugar phosphate isomerase/epimerase